MPEIPLCRGMTCVHCMVQMVGAQQKRCTRKRANYRLGYAVSFALVPVILYAIFMVVRSVMSHIGQVASLTSQVGIRTNQVEALQQFQEAYNQRVNMVAFQRLFQSSKAIDITVNLTQPSNNLLTDDGIINPL